MTGPRMAELLRLFVEGTAPKRCPERCPEPDEGPAEGRKGKGGEGTAGLVERLAREVNSRQQKYYNDLLGDIAREHGPSTSSGRRWGVYWAVVSRLVEFQTQQFRRQYQVADGDAYAVLGLTQEAPDEVVRFAYTALARRHHPDRGGDERRMAAINAAYRAIALQRGWLVRALPPGG